jgi:hypothetical protein
MHGALGEAAMLLAVVIGHHCTGILFDAIWQGRLCVDQNCWMPCFGYVWLPAFFTFSLVAPSRVDNYA